MRLIEIPNLLRNYDASWNLALQKDAAKCGRAERNGLLTSEDLPTADHLL